MLLVFSLVRLGLNTSLLRWRLLQPHWEPRGDEGMPSIHIRQRRDEEDGCGTTSLSSRSTVVIEAKGLDLRISPPKVGIAEAISKNAHTSVGLLSDDGKPEATVVNRR